MSNLAVIELKEKVESGKNKEGVPVVHAYTKSASLAQIYQSMAVQLSLMKKNEDNSFTVICPPCRCFDFICDIFSSFFQKHNFAIYGFSWKGAEESPDWSGVYLHITFPDQKAKDNFQKNIKFLHKIEDDNNIDRTVFHDLGGLNVISIGSKEWLQNCMKLRLYMFFFRAFCYEIKTDDWITELGAQSHSDSVYIKNLPRPSWDRILSDLTSIHMDEFCGLSFKTHGTGAVHHNSGLFGIASRHGEQNPDMVRKNKHWIALKERGFAMYIKE